MLALFDLGIPYLGSNSMLSCVRLFAQKSQAVNGKEGCLRGSQRWREDDVLWAARRRAPPDALSFSLP